VALPLIAVVALGASAGELGALRAVQQAPVLLLSLLVGAWVDRRRTRNVMVLSDLGRALVLGALPAAWLLGALEMPVLYAVALLVGVLTVCFDVAYQASVVRLVARDRLAPANSALEGSRSAAQIGGPAVGGSVVSVLSAPAAAAVSAAFFVLSCLSVRAVRMPEPQPGRGPGRMGQRIGEGVRLVLRDATLRSVAIASAIFQFSFAALMTVYLLYLPRVLDLSGAAIGLVLAALGPGALVGSWLAAVLPGRRVPYGVVLVSAAVIADAVMLGVSAVPRSGGVAVVLLVAVNFVFGVAGQVVDVTVVAVRQAIMPVEVQGRVVATMNFLGMGLTPLGSLLGGVLAAQWGLSASMLLTAVALALSPLFMALSPLARLGRTLPNP